MKKKRIILTYGTFDMYHKGHRNVIKSSKEANSLLYVGVATDEYVKLKGKDSLLTYEMRKALIEADELVDFVFPESNLDQWKEDYEKYDAKKIRISSEHFNTIKLNKNLNDLNIEYFPRTPEVSTTNIKKQLKEKKVVLTYGTYDLLHHGHINIFREAKKLGDVLIVGVSTDDFNKLKGKKSQESFSTRINNVLKNEFVDYVIPEMNWNQKITDIKNLSVNTIVMGGDWKGKFDHLSNEGVEINIIDRTEGISSTILRKK